MLSRFALVLSVLLAAFAADSIPPAKDLTVHEWGTFTSVAGEDGTPVSWAALRAPSDLPCFVYRLSAVCVKCNATSVVRMETPVLYFYTPRPTTVTVRVDLPSGVITEWYPKATGIPKDVTYGVDGKIDWGPVQLLPGAAPAYPTDEGPSHYYAARNTDSASLRIDDQQEKLLFYRGVAGEGVVLEPRLLPNGQMGLRNAIDAPIPFAALFENRGGRMGYRVVRKLTTPVTVDLPELTGDRAALDGELAGALTGAGLYPKEAAAMIETWRDSWFEEGMRVFYILPRSKVDSVLPLKITPAPSATERVFVGRVEVLSDATAQTLRAALASGDTATLRRCGRFLDPFVTQLMHTGRVTISQAARNYMDTLREQNAHLRVEPCKEPAPQPTEQQ
jgi:hypothetical protein